MRHIWRKEKLVRRVMELWRKDRISGLFLTSGVFRDPEEVAEKQIEIAKMLRAEGFSGYINLRLMPGTPRYLVEEACRVADRVGVNIEAATPAVFYEIAPDKGDYWRDIFSVLSIASKIHRERNVLRAGVATQLIIGIGNSDTEVLKLTELLVKKYRLTRVFYSPFEPIPDTPLENLPRCPHRRVKMLNQAFYLLRDYGFTLRDLEVLLDDKGMLRNFGNLKEAYALENRWYYPVDLRSASFMELLRVPGIGPRVARIILYLRERGKLNRESLVKNIGLKRYKKAMKYSTL